MAGTSTGAITGVLVALKFSAKEICDILETLDFNSFKDDSFLTALDLIRLYRKFGWYKGNAFKLWVAKTIAQKTDPEITFSELQKLVSKNKAKALYIIGADVEHKKEVIFSHETTPEMKIVDAVRISMSIPLFFQAVRLKGHIYVDGGLYYNYPVNLFDNEGFNKETLGLRVDKTEEIAHQLTGQPASAKEITNIKKYIQTLIGSLIDMANKRHLSERDWHRTIYIDCKNISSTDFQLSDKEKKSLIESGKRSTELYFDWYDKSRGSNMDLNK